MKLIVGLGNPGPNYKWTRHNVGFEVIDKFAYDFNINLNKSKFNSIYSETNIYNQKVILVKPLTYMNLSGEAVKQFFNFYKLNLQDLIIISDDINIPLGSIKIKLKGSHGGQNGLRNIIYHLNSEDFLRIRVGVGNKPPNFSLSEFVLSKFTQNEFDKIVQGITFSTQSLELILKENNGINMAMNQFNKKNN